MLGNALRYAAVEIEVTAGVHEDSVEFHVLDDGPGFPADFIPHAWERFTRADAARTDDGAGLGLSIVRTIAELHGGDAHAANRPTGGAGVWICLPRGARRGRRPVSQSPDAARASAAEGSDLTESLSGVDPPTSSAREDTKPTSQGGSQCLEFS